MRQRLIPVLLIREGGLMKSQGFDSWRYIGDPLNTAKIFNDKDTDEIVILDVQATQQGREPNYELLRSLAAECFLPLAYGGGVISEAAAKKVVECGIDKVIVNTALGSESKILEKISSSIGSSSTVASLDFVRNNAGFQTYNRQGLDLKQAVLQAEEQGAGEILIQSVDRDGTRLGPDLDLASEVLEASNVPVVYAGGVSSLDDAADLWKLGVDGVGVGTWFVFRPPHDAVLITYPSRKRIREAFHDD